MTDDVLLLTLCIVSTTLSICALVAAIRTMERIDMIEMLLEDLFVGEGSHARN